MALESQLTRTLSALLLAATGIIVIVPGPAQAAARPGPRPVIVFEGAPEQGAQVVGADANGNRQRRLTSGPHMGEMPRWGPFGRRILYLRSTTDGRRDLMVMGPRGRDKHHLLYGRDRFITDMAWGPRGGRVALVMSPRRTANFADIYMFSLETRKLTRLHVNSFPSRDPASLDWSRDGKTIAFSAVDYTEDDDDFEDHDLYLIRPDGTGLRQITNTSPLDELNPRFSPGRESARLFQGALGRPGVRHDRRRRRHQPATTADRSRHRPPGGLVSGMGATCWWRRITAKGLRSIPENDLRRNGPPIPDAWPQRQLATPLGGFGGRPAAGRRRLTKRRR